MPRYGSVVAGERGWVKCGHTELLPPHQNAAPTGLGIECDHRATVILVTTECFDSLRS